MSNPDFDTYRLSDDHEAIREAVRAVAEDKIAPFAAAVDEEARYPQEAHDALVASRLLRPARAARSTAAWGPTRSRPASSSRRLPGSARAASLIPAVNKLGSMPLILAANDDVKTRYLTPLAAGETTFSYGLSEREAGSDTAAMRCRAVRDGDDWVLTGQKSWITNAGVSQYYTVLAVTDPDGQRGNNITAFVVEKTDPGFSFGEKERKLGIKGSPTRELIFERTRIPGDRVVGEVGAGLKIALATLDHTRVTIGAQAVGIAQGALDHAMAYVKERKQFGKRIADFQGIQFMLADMAMELEAARQLVYVAAAKSERGDADLPFFGAAAKCFASDVAMKVTTDAVQLLGGAGLHPRLPARADDARREDHPDLRGHQPGAARRHGPPAPQGLSAGPQAPLGSALLQCAAGADVGRGLAGRDRLGGSRRRAHRRRRRGSGSVPRRFSTSTTAGAPARG